MRIAQTNRRPVRWDPALHPRDPDGRFREKKRGRLSTSFGRARVIRAIYGGRGPRTSGWSEAQHPRDSKGKFAPKGTGRGAAGEARVTGGSVEDRGNLKNAIEGGQSYEVEDMGTSSANEVFLVTFEDGTQGVWKKADDESLRTSMEWDLEDIDPDYYQELMEVGGFESTGWADPNQAQGEVLFHEMDQALGFGLTPEAQYFSMRGQDGVIVEYIGNSQVGLDIDIPTTTALIDGPDGERIAALDFVMANSDRHDGNWLLSEDTGRIIAIDNGRNHAVSGWPPPGDVWLGNRLGIQNASFEFAYQDRPLSAGTRAALEGLHNTDLIAIGKRAGLSDAETKAFVGNTRDRIEELLNLDYHPGGFSDLDGQD